MRFSDRETVGPERVYWRQFSSDLRLFTEGLWHAKPQSYGALDTTANEIMTSALSSRRVRSQGREDRMRMSGRTRLRVVGDSGGQGDREKERHGDRFPRSGGFSDGPPCSAGNPEVRGAYKGTDLWVGSWGRRVALAHDAELNISRRVALVTDISHEWRQPCILHGGGNDIAPQGGENWFLGRECTQKSPPLHRFVTLQGTSVRKQTRVYPWY